MAVPGEHNMSELLTAFSDGELGAEDNQRVLRHLQAHPDALTALEIEQRLRAAAHRAVTQSTPTVSETLKAQIARLAIETPLKDKSVDGPSPMRIPAARHRQWIGPIALACAASIVVGVTVGHLEQADSTPVMHVFGPEPGPVDTATIALITRTHVNCSRMPTLHHGGYPRALDGLADIVKQDLNRDQPFPDLSSVGYRFLGAEQCVKPMHDVMHLLYTSDQRIVRDTLSVFVEPYHGQLTIDAGRAYSLTTKDAAHPTLVWRTNQAIYFVVGDNSEEVSRACESIGLAKL